MKERITCACAGGHINTSFQCLNTNLWGAGAGALLGLWDREPSGSLSLEFGAMMRDRISENSKIVGVELWQPHFNFKTFSQELASWLCRSAVYWCGCCRLAQAGSAPCHFFSLETWRNEAALAALRCAGMLSQECPVLFGFGSEGMIAWEDHTLHVCGSVEWFVRNIFVLFGLVMQWHLSSEVAAWSEIASPIFLTVLIQQQKSLSCLLQLRTAQRDLFQVASCYAFCVEKAIKQTVIGHRLVCWLLLMSMGQASFFVVEVHRSPLSTPFEGFLHCQHLRGKKS